MKHIYALWLVAFLLFTTSSAFDTSSSVFTVPTTLKSRCEFAQPRHLSEMTSWPQLKKDLETIVGTKINKVYTVSPSSVQGTWICYQHFVLKKTHIDGYNCQQITSNATGTTQDQGRLAVNIKSGYTAALRVSDKDEQKTVSSDIETFSASYPVYPGVVAQGSLSLEFTTENKQSSLTGKSENITTIIEHQVEIKSNPGEQCHVELKTKQCTTNYNAHVPFLVKGYFWVEFDGLAGTKLFHLDQMLSAEKRIFRMPMKMSLDTESYGQFQSVCNCTIGTCKNSSTALDRSSPLYTEMNTTADLDPKSLLFEDD